MSRGPQPPRAGTPLPRALALVVVVACFACTGASCPGVIRGYQIGTMPLPRTLPANPSLDQIIATVHDNTQRVRSYMAPQAVLAAEGVPRLSARVACEPPRQFRLQARTAVSGEELDIGSNNDLFWLWVRRHEPPVMLFCRHDSYARSAARRLLPVKAEQMPELLGLVTFAPGDRHEGPFPLPDGRIEIRSHLAAAAASDGSVGETLVKSTILDGVTALVQEQHLFTADGRRIASARTSGHRVDAASGAALPRTVEVDWPEPNIKFKLEIVTLSTNTPTGDPGQLWQMPAYPGYAPVDLADPAVTITPRTGP